MADCLTDEDRALLGQLLIRELEEIKNTPDLASRKQAVEALIQDVPKMTMCAPKAARTQVQRAAPAASGDGATAIASAGVDVFIDTAEAELAPTSAKAPKSKRAKTPRSMFMSHCLKGKEKGGLELTLKRCSAMWKEQKGAAPKAATTPNGAPEVVLVDGRRSAEIAARTPGPAPAPMPFAEPHPELRGG